MVMPSFLSLRTSALNGLRSRPSFGARMEAATSGWSPMAAMVARVLRLERPPEPLDVTDALALAVTYLTRPALR